MTEIGTRHGSWIDTRPDPWPPRIEPDEFDLDLRLGELAAWRPGHRAWLGPIVVDDAQTDGGGCLPTGGKGEGGTCDTDDNTCAGTCAGRGTCPVTGCGATCPDTHCTTCGHTNCGATCANTCPKTDCGHTCAEFTNCHATCANTHCFTCSGHNCAEP